MVGDVLDDEINQQLSEFLTNTKTLESVAPYILRYLGEKLNWQWGLYWKIDPKIGVLRAAAIWKTESIGSTELESDSKRRMLASGEDLAGQSWRNRKPIWSVDLAMQMALPRSLKTTSAGMKCGVWFPLKTPRATYGVIELLGFEALPANERILELFDAVGSQLGEFVESVEIFK